LEYQRSGSDGGGSYYPVIEFRTVRNEAVVFRGSVGSNPPSFRRGEQVRVLYDPTTPEIAKIDSFFQLWFLPLVLGVMGLTFGGAGGGYWAWYLAKLRRGSWLQGHGRPVDADIVDIGVDRSLTVNGRSPWRITAQWLDPSGDKLHLFKSDHIWFDPEPFVDGDKIRVLIDPQNPDRYSIDLSFLPELAR
jgi:hypothetical protein